MKDFRSVDYEAIAMLNVSATQELTRKLAAQSAELTQLRTEKATLAQQFAAREARLTRLEAALDTKPARTVRASLDLQ